MNMLFIVHYATLYGANRSLLTLLIGLRERHKVNCCVLVPSTGPLTEALTDLGFDHVIGDAPWWFSRERSGTLSQHIKERLRWIKREMHAVRAVRKLIRERRIDIVHTNSSVVATGMLAALLERKKHVWHLREFATLDYLLRPLAGMGSVRWLMRRSNGVICVSNAVQAHFRIPERNAVRVIYNGVASSAQMAAVKSRSAPMTDHGAFCIIGVVSAEKGHDVALEALQKVKQHYPEVQLHIIGEGAYLKEVESMIDQRNLSGNVVIHGFLEDVRGQMKACDALLMCSRHEAMGRVTAEAMSEGIPVIGLETGGTKELIEHGTDGLLFSGGPDELADRMIELLSDRDRYARLSNAALQKARAWFSNENYVDRVYDLHRMLIENRSDLRSN